MGSLYHLRYAGIDLDLEADDGMMSSIASEVEPFFIAERGSERRPGATHVNLMLARPPEGLTPPTLTPRTIKVDTSLYKHLASDGLRWERERGHVVLIQLTGSYVVVSPQERSIELYQPDRELLVLDAIRLIKGLLTVMVEHSGGVQLHSSSVEADGRGVLLLGDMWQGKTTLLLELLEYFQVSQLSCDTTVVVPKPQSEGGLAAYGWPSPFSVSHGTMADHPVLHEYLPTERRTVSYETLWAEGKKTVLTSQQVVRLFNSRLVPACEDLAMCLIVRFKPDEPTAVRKVEHLDELVTQIRTVYLGSRDPIYHNWLEYRRISDDLIEANIRQIAETLYAKVPAYVMTWAPSAVSLMKRIPFLAGVHKGLSRLRAPAVEMA